ncbi:MAG: protein-L-isoaspartate(D-aspartate) O-methyltransferase [Bryobacteraceae bacterium]|nr:protein-L-isoaspartate(D-aspartate) O-methyltransferase [Bryobacteraceae bacterium]
MIREQIEARGMREPKVLAALRKVNRHWFVPEAYRKLAYQDHPLSIGHGQTISQPYIVALMTELLEVEKNHRVLEIGTGSGYQAAVLSHVAGEVYSIEVVEDLAKTASKLLQDQGCRNVTVRYGDGYAGWPDRAPFDRIILTAAPPEIPSALLEQLKPGGKLVAPVGRADQELVVVEKDRHGKLSRRPVIPVRFVPMIKKPAA